MLVAVVMRLCGCAVVALGSADIRVTSEIQVRVTLLVDLGYAFIRSSEHAFPELHVGVVPR